MMDYTGDIDERSQYLEKPAKQTVLCVLNERWRVVHDGRSRPYSSWELQYRAAPGKWHSKSFCQHNWSLMAAIMRKAGDCDPAALAVVTALPERAY
ncbi:hypothetical protein IB262_21230 [Ensifer sp. ENS02]|uniref:hypothetical protein n=1 Tax=Ensifer sp. ENS02 TaxID=2769290 RepID=UPI00177DDC9C|nr:hypothetical protein [Ensifer sp. ENS02]MBD9522422.1 hypothetical protein [Ensifer sp. ENS02]